jgi:hypothetical protein
VLIRGLKSMLGMITIARRGRGCCVGIMQLYRVQMEFALEKPKRAVLMLGKQITGWRADGNARRRQG